jgi:type 1 glutamine amidotransferase
MTSWRSTFTALALCLSLAGGAFAQSPAKKKLLLIGQGPDGHPKTTHEYVAGLKILEKCLAPASKDIDVRFVFAAGQWPEGPDLIKAADGVVLYLAEGAKWVHDDPRRHESLAQLAARGGGLTALHWATGTREAKNIEGYLKLLGACHGGPDRKYKFLETSVEVADKEHPITRGLENFTIKDEFYYQLKFIPDLEKQKLIPLLKAKIDDELFPVSWAWDRPDGGRSFGFTAMHYHENWRRPEYRRFVSQGVLWTLKLEPPKENFPGEVKEEDYKLP